MPTLWPFAPNIRQAPYVLSREYRTEILVSRAGREQARALRQTPRKRVEYITSQTGDCLRAFNNSMVTAQRTLLSIPDRVRYVTLSTGLPSGNTSVVVDPLPAWVAEGESLILMGGGMQAFRTVASIIGTTVTFDESELVTYPAGTRLHPSLQGYLAATIPAPMISPRGVIEVAVSFEVDPGLELPEDVGTAETTFDGREVFLRRPNKWVPIDLGRVQEGIGRVDYGFGRIQRFFPIEFSTVMWEASYTGCDFENADALRQFFDRMKGRRGEFYMPTWGFDLNPTAGVNSAGTLLTVAGEGLEAAYADSTTYQAIGLRKTDGTWILRTVTDISDLSGDGAAVNVSPAWDETISLSNIDRISWLPLWRFASDILTMTWPRDTVAEIRLPMQMLENQAAEA